jgi:hypothetical protein
MYTDNMLVDVTRRRAVFVFPGMKQNIWGHKFEDGGYVAKIVTRRMVRNTQTDIGK